MNRPLRTLILLGLLCLSSTAQAFDLQQLSDQLAKPAVVQGRFVQEKHLRALPQPLLSKGRFVLAGDFGLLWLLETPLKQDYRINAEGIARRETDGNVSTGSRCRTRTPAPSRTVCSGGIARRQQRPATGLRLAAQGQANAAPHPHATLDALQQVFKQINIDGGELVQRIELLETRGDSTVLKMIDSSSAPILTDAQRNDFKD